MVSFILTATAVLGLSASSLAASAPDFTCTCNGLEAPNWSDCDAIAKANFEGEQSTVQHPTPAPGLCNYYFVSNSSNCVITICPVKGVPQGTNFTGEDILINYDTLDSTCRAEAGSPGGQCGPGPDEPKSGFNLISVSAYANPNYTQSAVVDPAKGKTANLLVAAAPPTKRQHSRDIVVRQDTTPPSSDTSYTNYVTSVDVNAPGAKFLVFGPSPSGSKYTVQKTHSSTKSVMSSANLSDMFFEEFSLSVGISTTYSSTFSEEVGYSVPINCPDNKRGVVYWTPLYTHYEGLYEPSGTQADWYIANSGAQTSYEVTCLD